MFQEGGDRGRVGVVEGGQCGEEFKQEDFQGQEEVKMDDKGLDLYSCMSVLSFLFWSEVYIKYNSVLKSIILRKDRP